MIRVPHGVLKLLAATVWYVGGTAMLIRGLAWLFHAEELMGGAAVWPWVSGLAGTAVGVLRGRTMFRRACTRNLARIDGLTEPKLWQFFRPGFFLALVVMMGGGMALSRVAARGYWGSVVVGGAELAIALGLLTSSVVFWAWGRTRPEPATARAESSER